MDIHVEVWSGPHGAFPPPPTPMATLSQGRGAAALLSFQEAT